MERPDGPVCDTRHNFMTQRFSMLHSYLSPVPFVITIFLSLPRGPETVTPQTCFCNSPPIPSNPLCYVVTKS